jgi:tetratricopeptide (TPR) repeat protein
VSCHDPHALPASEETASYFRQRCLNCHAEQTPCSVPPEVRRKQEPDDSCVACHMPRSKTRIAHLAATDHRILRRPERAGEAPSSGFLPSSRELPLVAFHQNLVDPEDPEVSRALGVALMQLSAGQSFGEPFKGQLAEQALPLLARAPEDAVTLEARGDAFQYQGRFAEALAAYDAAVAKAPWRDYSLVQAAQAAERLGRSAAALDYCKRALAVRPWLWLHHYHVARLQAKLHDWTTALGECQEAVRLNPFIAEVRMLQVRCLLTLGNKENARAAFEDMLALIPSQAEELRRRFADQLR